MPTFAFSDIVVYTTKNDYDSQILHIQVDGGLHTIELYEADIPQLIEAIQRAYNSMQSRRVLESREDHAR